MEFKTKGELPTHRLITCRGSKSPAGAAPLTSWSLVIGQHSD
jgi:hypothetical protein